MVTTCHNRGCRIAEISAAVALTDVSWPIVGNPNRWAVRASLAHGTPAKRV